MRRLVPATRRLIVLLLALAVSVLGMVVPRASSAQAAAGDPVSYAYDDAGNLKTVKAPTGSTANNDYNVVGELTKATDPAGRNILRREMLMYAHAPLKEAKGKAVTLTVNGQDDVFQGQMMGQQQNDDGSIDIYFGPESPAGHENNWLQTVPGKGWFTILRLYGALEPWFDKTWRPGEIELVEE